LAQNRNFRDQSFAIRFFLLTGKGDVLITAGVGCSRCCGSYLSRRGGLRAECFGGQSLSKAHFLNHRLLIVAPWVGTGVGDAEMVAATAVMTSGAESSKAAVVSARVREVFGGGTVSKAQYSNASVNNPTVAICMLDI
jgi:hypothetical protein